MAPFRWGKRPKKRLTKKQLAQRKYAARMRRLRTQAAKRPGGQGRIGKRKAATRLRKRLGLKRR